MFTSIFCNNKNFDGRARGGEECFAGILCFALPSSPFFTRDDKTSCITFCTTLMINLTLHLSDNNQHVGIFLMTRHFEPQSHLVLPSPLLYSTLLNSYQVHQHATSSVGHDVCTPSSDLGFRYGLPRPVLGCVGWHFERTFFAPHMAAGKKGRIEKTIAWPTLGVMTQPTKCRQPPGESDLPGYDQPKCMFKTTTTQIQNAFLHDDKTSFPLAVLELPLSYSSRGVRGCYTSGEHNWFRKHWRKCTTLHVCSTSYPLPHHSSFPSASLLSSHHLSNQQILICLCSKVGTPHADPPFNF